LQPAVLGRPWQRLLRPYGRRPSALLLCAAGANVQAFNKWNEPVLDLAGQREDVLDVLLRHDAQGAEET
jgi:hypothetical protein